MKKIKDLLKAIIVIAIVMILALIIAWLLWIIKKYWEIAMLILLPIFLILLVYGAYKNDKDKEE